MKNIKLFLALLVFSCFIPLKAETKTEISYGIKAGLNLASLNGQHNVLHLNSNTVVEPSSRYGMVLGGLLSIEFSKQFTTQIELNYTNRGVVYDVEDYVQIWALDYLELPVLFKSVFKMQERYPTSVFIGPVLAYNINAKWSDKVLKEYAHEDESLKGINSYDLAVALGGSMEFKVFGGMMGMDARYTYGLLTIKDGISAQNGVISFSLYYKFPTDKEEFDY